MWQTRESEDLAEDVDRTGELVGETGLEAAVWSPDGRWRS